MLYLLFLHHNSLGTSINDIFYYQLKYKPCSEMVIVVENGHGDPSLIPDEAVCIACSLGKSMNLTILHPAMGE